MNASVILPDENITLPEMVRVEQRLDDDGLTENQVIETLLAQLAGPVRQRVRPGMRVAVAVGSRGIASLDILVRTILDMLRRQGAQPFIIPAMGSHGGGTSAGQRNVLAHYGITEETMGVSIEDTMDTTCVGEVDGYPVYFSVPAATSDLIIPVCRIKPHTDFTGSIESGICKMLAIGLGKHKGAATLHAAGFESFAQLIPRVGEFLLKHTPLGFSVATVENALDRPAHLQVVLAEDTLVEEPKLLVLARNLLPRIQIDPIDVLIVDEIGKDVSGEGMDPNVTGRAATGIQFPDTPRIRRIAVRGLTADSQGNATGIGMADFTTDRCFQQMDLSMTYTNILTARVPSSGKLPVILANDREMIFKALYTLGHAEPATVRVVRIRNTLSLASMWVSPAVAEELKSQARFTVTSERRELTFDTEGYLTW